MWLRIITLIVFFLITTFLFVTFNAGPRVWSAFLFNTCIIGVIFFYHLFIERTYSPFLSAYIVFNFLFFTVAPIIQINNIIAEDSTFVTKFPYIPELAFYVNYLIAVFHLSFFAAYFYLKKYKVFSKTPQLTSRDKSVQPLTIFLLAIVSLIIFACTINFIIDEIYRPAWVPLPYSISEFLVLNKVLFMIPFAGIVLSWNYLKIKKKFSKNKFIIAFCLLLMLCILLWFKNPLIEKRNALGPIYISLIFLFAPKILDRNYKSLSFIFFAMVVAFPAFAIFTHSDAGWKQIVKNPYVFFEHNKANGIAETFNTLHYDAFFNSMTTVQYISENGFANGNQMLGSILFAVPRGIWDEKPLSTGKIIGNYLIDEYEFNFANLANPLVSEGYINFGVLGVILFAVLLAIFITKLRSWIDGGDYLKQIMAFYFSIHLLFLLRGDLMNGLSYYIGVLVAVWIIPKILNLIIKQSVLKKEYV